MAVRDRINLFVGATTQEVDILHEKGVEVSGLRWHSVLPGGHASCSFSIAAFDPTLPVRNALKTDAKLWVKYGDTTLWQGWVLPLEREFTAESGVVHVECEGTLARAKRHQCYPYTWHDQDTGNWYTPDTHNSQYGSDNQGQLLLYLNKGSAATDGTAGAAQQRGFLRYWMHDGRHLNSQCPITKLTYTYDVNVGAANWYARISEAASPWGSWSTLKTWNNTTAAGTETLTLSADMYAISLGLWSSSDVAAVAATRYVKLTGVTVKSQDTAPTIDSAQYDLLTDAALCTSQEVETLDTLAHLAYRDSVSIADMLADIARRSASTIDWALWGDLHYCRSRPAIVPRNTVALRRSDLTAGSDAIYGDYESAVDGVAVLYASDGTGSVTKGSYQIASYGTITLASRVTVLDKREQIMSPTAAAAVAQQEHARLNADVYRGTITLPLSRPLANTYRAAVDPLTIWAGRGWALDRTYEIGHTPLTITGTEFDIDSDTVTLTVGPQEERDLYEPWTRGPLGVRKRKVGKGKKRHWEFR